MSMFNNFVSTLRQFAVKTPQIQPVRYRYHAEKKKYIRRYGYEDHLARSGLLPHYGDEKVKPFPEYKYVIVIFPRKSKFFYMFKKCVTNHFFIFLDQKMRGVKSVLCLVKMITSTSLAMKTYTQP